MSQANKVTIPIEGMTCQHCAASVKAAVSKLPGVKEVAVDLKSGWAVVAGENLNVENIRATIDAIGFTAGTPK